MADANEQLSDELRDLADKMGQTGGAAGDVIKSLLLLASAQKKDANLKEDIVKAQARQKEGYDKIEQGLRKLGTSAAQVMMSFSSVTASIYNSDKAFTAVIPVIDLMANVTKSFVEAVGLAASGITILGTGTGKVSEAIAKFVTTGIDVATAAVKQQIESTQKLFDNFDNLSKAGVTFGGSINKLAMSAADGGLSIDTYTKIVTKNAETFNALGGSVERGAANVVKFGRRLAEQDQVLFATYGGYEGLNSAIAEYAALQTKMGISGAQLNKDLEGSARAYLYQQKELATLTGKSTEQLKKESDERMKVAAYQVALGKMGAKEALNAEYMVSQMRAKYGAQGEKYAMEYIANQGQVISKTGLQLEAMVPELRTVTGEMYGNLKQSSEDFKTSTNGVITANEGAISERAKSAQFERFYQINQAGYNNEVIGAMTEFGSTVLKTSQAQKDASAAQADINKNNKASDKDAAKMYADALGSLEGFKTKMDALTITHLPQVADQMKLAYTAAAKLADGLNMVNDTIAFMQGSMTASEYKTSLEVRAKNSGKDVSALEAERSKILEYGNRKTLSADRVKELDIIEAKIAELKGLQSTTPPAAPDKSDKKEADLPKRAMGDPATNGPVIAGEKGPEAIIPLPDGRTVPTNIDLSPLTRVMREFVDIAKDQRDIQERLLNNSY